LVIHVLMIIFSHGHIIIRRLSDNDYIAYAGMNRFGRRIDRVIINKSNNAELSSVSAGWESVPTWCRIYVNTHNDWRSSDNNNNNNVQQTKRERERESHPASQTTGIDAVNIIINRMDSPRQPGSSFLLLFPCACVYFYPSIHPQ
jgi:hypothetical protein